MLTIQKAENPIDIDILSQTADEIWHEFFPGIISEEQIDYMIDRFLSPEVLTDQLDEGYEYYFAIDENKQLVGFTVIHPEQDTKKLFLSKIYLYESVRGRGYAGEIFAFIKERAGQLGMQQIYLTVNKHNDTAIPVYQHWGFQATDSVVSDIGLGYVMDDYVMSIAV